MEEERPRVFISYSSLDGDFAELMKLKLEAAGVDVWRDVNEILPGEEWRNEIDYGLLNSDSIVVLLNENSCNSPYVTYEWAFALGNGKNIIPVLQEDCELHPRIKVLQYLDFKDGKRPWDKLAERINDLYQKSAAQKSNDGELTIDEIIEGIKSLANANANAVESRNAASLSMSAAANKIMNASNYLKSVENKLDTILWVNDNPDGIEHERHAFKSLGFKSDVAVNTEEALKHLEANKYAVIVSDMGRAEGPQEGYALLRKMREQNNQTPFIIYSSSDRLEHKKMAHDEGAQGATNRPDELIDMVTTHIQHQAK